MYKDDDNNEEYSFHKALEDNGFDPKIYINASSDEKTEIKRALKLKLDKRMDNILDFFKKIL